MAYRRTAETQARLDDTRRRIVEAARDLVAEGGFGALQMAAVAEAAGVATGTLYKHFPSKEEICRQVFRDVSVHEMALLSTIANEDGPVVPRLARLVRTFAGRAVRARRLSYALLGEPVDEALTQERLFFRRTHAEIFARVIENGIERGDLPTQEVTIASRCISGAIPTALIGPLSPDSHALDTDTDADAVVEALVSFCLRAVGADPETATPLPAMETA